MRQAPSIAFTPKSRIVLLNQDSRDLSNMPASSVDLILTDPPYYDNLPYSEYSDFYYAWLRGYLPSVIDKRRGRHAPMGRSLLARPEEPQGDKEFITGLSQVFRECHRLLREDGVFVFTFHHNDERAWRALARVLLSSGFVVTNLFPLRSEGASGFHSDEGNLKFDATFICRRRPDVSGPSFLAGPARRRIQAARERWQGQFGKGKNRLLKGDLRSLEMASLCAYLTTTRATRKQVDVAFSSIFPAKKPEPRRRVA